MVFGFKKPSRSYASSQTSNYHPETGYPTGIDSRSVISRETVKARPTRSYRQNSSSEDDSVQESRIRRRDYGEDRYHNDHSGTLETSPISLKKRPSTRVTRVAFESPLTETPPSHLDSTPFPTFRPKSSSSSHTVLAQRAATPTKKKRVKTLEKQIQQFSVLDLAPPPPQPKSKKGKDGDRVSLNKGSRASTNKPHNPNVGPIQPVNHSSRTSTASNSEAGSDIRTGETASELARRNGVVSAPQPAVSYVAPQPLREAMSRGTLSNLTNSRSPSPSLTAQGRTDRYNVDHGELTPPMSDLGRRNGGNDRSYDAASPWTPVILNSRPPSRAASVRREMDQFSNPSPHFTPPETDSAGSSQLSVNRKRPQAPAGVSRSYKSVRRNERRQGTRDESEDIPYHEEQQSSADESEIVYDQRYREETPVNRVLGSLTLPTLALQPPTPYKEDEMDSPLDQEMDKRDLSALAEEKANITTQSIAAPAFVPPPSPQRPARHPDRPRMNSTTSVQTPPIVPSDIQPVMPPPPSDPNSTAYLKWDQATHRWVPVISPPTPPESSNDHASSPSPSRTPPRTESVVSATSAYSQASAPVYGLPAISQNRRGSVPAIQTSPGRLLRKGASPGPSPLSRPSSPAHSRAGSLGDYPPALGPMVGAGNRRMSIEPAYQLGATTLTLLPEMHEMEDPYVPRAAASDYGPTSSSRPPSRATSIRSHRMPTPRTEPFRPSSATGVSPSRNGLNFPSGYDINQRVSHYDRSDYGDYMNEGESRYRSGTPKARAQSMGGGSHYAPSMSGSQYGEPQFYTRVEKVGRESALGTMSVRGDSVPLLGADGTGEEGRGGYSGMILPAGAYKTSDPTKNVNKLDARVLGMPSSTMSTITLSGNTGGNVSRRLSMTALARPSRPATPAHLQADLPPPITFSAHQAPPTKITTSQVLVQVYAVALDRFDFDMVKEKTDHGAGAGKWIPGRSFVGRALEIGAEVRQVTKGDMVIGLVDIKKSGTLAEYIVVDRRRIARTPLGSHLSLEQQACLPLLGVMAHRACVGLTRGARALVLNAHEGVGSLVCQELSHHGIYVIAQVPPIVDSAEDDAWDNGAKEVVVDEPIAMLNGQHESGFELILDTCGGRHVYDAARRVLRSNGMYVTLFGDDADHLASGPQVKTSLHALRRAFVKKDKKAISYIHLMPGGGDIDVSGLDSRDILELPIMSHYVPKVGMVVPFERAPDAFTELATVVAGRTREESGSVVVRLMN